MFLLVGLPWLENQRGYFDIRRTKINRPVISLVGRIHDQLVTIGGI